MAQTGCTSTQYVIPLSGGTIFTPIHPVMTKGDDETKTVVQCGDVLLGGNGLYS
jgi:hypothetical protein